MRFQAIEKEKMKPNPNKELESAGGSYEFFFLLESFTFSL
jgi:hypothetical protein